MLSTSWAGKFIQLINKRPQCIEHTSMLPGMNDVRKQHLDWLPIAKNNQRLAGVAGREHPVADGVSSTAT